MIALITASATILVLVAYAVLLLARADEHFAKARLTRIRGTIERDAEAERRNGNGRNALDSATSANRDPMPDDRSSARRRRVHLWTRTRRSSRNA